ncbi:protein kinase domain-containing protein [Phthorimaea operculella]|nr:protein kinase domain-containing protein [Phthorimaea operculella]
MDSLKELLEDLTDVAEEDPYIEEHLKHAVAFEQGYVTFDAKIDGRVNCTKWYKDGEEIVPNLRFKVRVRRAWYTLKIRNLQKSDTGVYTIVCQNDTNYAISQATLHVLPGKRLGLPCPRNCTARYLTWTSSLEITQHLKNLKIRRGDPIVLRVEIDNHTNVQPVFTWLKNQRTLSHEGIEMVCKENKFAEYVLYNTDHQDSGTYTVVISLDDIMVSSTAEVVIMEPDYLQDERFFDADKPYFIQFLPDDLEVLETEEVTMLCKAVLLPSTDVFFYKDGKALEADANIIFGNVENRGLKIHIKRASVKDTGFYTIILRQRHSKRIAITKCLLSVNIAPRDRDTVLQVALLQPLTNCIGNIGIRMCFYCKFDLPKNYLFYVVWRVGFYQIERDTPQFKLMRDDHGVFAIFITRLDPDMMGEVSCQLRCMIPTKKSIQVAITKCYLMNVPREVMEGDDKLEECKTVRVDLNWNKSSAVYENSFADAGQEYDDDDGKQSEAAARLETIDEECISSHTTPLKRPEELGMTSSQLLEIIYCRLKDDFGHFVTLEKYKQRPIMLTAEISTRLEAQKECVEESIDIEWEEGRDPRFDNWYLVEMKQPSGKFKKVGKSSSPRICLQDPMPERMMTFRVHLIKAGPGIKDLVIPPSPVKEIDEPSQVPAGPIEEFKENYTTIGDTLGIGAYGAVYLVRSREGSFLAAKVVKTRTEKRRDTTRREIEILKRLNHKRIVRLHAFYTSREQMVMIMDYLWGGELFERIVEEENFKERTAVHYIKQICEGLEYLHAQSIVHLDIKPENVVCTSRNSRDIKIVDFGLSRVLENGIVRAIYGTRDYIAPEVLSYEAIQTASDMWSLGVVTYIMLSGTLPFVGDTWADRAAAITKGTFDFSDPAFDMVTTDAKRFIQTLLTLDPKDRLTARSAQQHRWMQADAVEDTGVGQTQRWRANMRTYLETNKAIWQRAGNVVIAANRLMTGVSHRESHQRLAT